MVWCIHAIVVISIFIYLMLTRRDEAQHHNQYLLAALPCFSKNTPASAAHNRTCSFIAQYWHSWLYKNVSGKVPFLWFGKHQFLLFLSMLLCHTEYSITNRVYLQICGNCFEKTLFSFNVTVSRCIKKYFFPVWCGWNWLAWHRALTSTTLNAFGMNRHMSCEPGLVAQNQYQQ